MENPKNQIKKGLFYELIAFPLLFAAPILITVGLKAVRHYHNYWLLILGIIVGFIAVFLGYKGIQLILDGFFDKSNEY